MSKILFLDIDGTMVDFDKTIAESTKRGLEMAKAKGNKIIVCSGRVSTDIYPPLLELGFDGMITSAGARVDYQGVNIYHNTLDATYLRRLVELMKRYAVKDRFSVAFQGSCGRCCERLEYDRMWQNFVDLDAHPENLMSGIQVVEDVTQQPELENGIYTNLTIDIQELQKLVDEELDGYFQITGASFGPDRSHSGEITRKGVNKATGMERLLAYLGLIREDSYGFGDGPNDFEMMEYAGTGIAMGNAVEDLKAIADYVTDPIDQDGLYHAFQYYGLI